MRYRSSLGRRRFGRKQFSGSTCSLAKAASFFASRAVSLTQCDSASPTTSTRVNARGLQPVCCWSDHMRQSSGHGGPAMTFLTGVLPNPLARCCPHIACPKPEYECGEYLASVVLTTDVRCCATCRRWPSACSIDCIGGLAASFEPVHSAAAEYDNTFREMQELLSVAWTVCGFPADMPVVAFGRYGIVNRSVRSGARSRRLFICRYAAPDSGIGLFSIHLR